MAETTNQRSPMLRSFPLLPVRSLIHVIKLTGRDYQRVITRSTSVRLRNSWQRSFFAQNLVNVSILVGLRLEFQQRCNAFMRLFFKLAILCRPFFRLINSTRSLQVCQKEKDRPPWKISSPHSRRVSWDADECGPLLRSLFRAIRQPPVQSRSIFRYLEDLPSNTLDRLADWWGIFFSKSS